MIKKPTEEWRTWDDKILRSFLIKLCELPIETVEGLVHERATAGGAARIDREVARCRAEWAKGGGVFLLRKGQV